MTEMQRANIPSSFIETAKDRLADHSVGFLRIDRDSRNPDANLVGSGTLVRVSDKLAILTAHHVLEALPTSGELGLELASSVPLPFTVDAGALRYLKIARGDDEGQGPDIGAVVLSPDIGSSLDARKSFINLDRWREQLLIDPPGLDWGMWFVQGYVAEQTLEHMDMQGYRRIKVFRGFSSAGCVEEAPSVGSFDYFSFPIDHSDESNVPKSYGGTSGGGLWQVTGVRNSEGIVEPKEYLLSGIAFYQDPIESNQSAIRCHGRNSVYRVAYEAIRDH